MNIDIHTRYTIKITVILFKNRNEGYIYIYGVPADHGNIKSMEQAVKAAKLMLLTLQTITLLHPLLSNART